MLVTSLPDLRSIYQVIMSKITASLLGTSPLKIHAYEAAAVTMPFLYYGVSAAVGSWYRGPSMLLDAYKDKISTDSR